MTAAERVQTIAGELDTWKTAAEIAHTVQREPSWVRWGIQAYARTRPVFARKRSATVKEYRIFPEAVNVTRS